MATEMSHVFLAWFPVELSNDTHNEMYSVGFLNFYLRISDVAWCLETATQPLAECFIIYDVLNMQLKLSEEIANFIHFTFALNVHGC